MNRQDIEKLLGGYSAGILTPAEERVLFAAALEDQGLFDALVREQPLGDLLGDPAARAGLLAALADQPLPWYRRIAGWAVEPRALASLAVVLCLTFTLTYWAVSRRKPQPVVVSRASPQPIQTATADRVPEAARIPPARKAPTAALPHKPQFKTSLGGGAPPAAELGETRPVANKPEPAMQMSFGAATAGVVGGVPQALGRLTSPEVSPAGNQVGPSPAPPPAPAARQVMAPVLLAAPPPVNPLHWVLLRRRPGGEYAAADAGDLQAGDAVKLQVECPYTGYVYLAENEKLLARSRIEAGQPFEAAVEPQGPGRRDLQLWYSPYEIAWPAAGRARPGFFQNVKAQAAGGTPAAQDSGARAGSGGAAPNAPVSVPITLDYR